MAVSNGEDPRVVVLGDSNAFGFGISKDKTLAAQIGNSLRDRGKEVGVLNAGVPGYDLLQPILLMKDLPIHEGMLFVFLVHPVNDLVNSANEIDYHAHKPYIYENSGSIYVHNPYSHFPQVDWRFSRDFQKLNQIFNLPGNERSLLDRLSDMSALIYMLRYSRSLSFFRSKNEPDEILWDNMSTEEYVNMRLEAIRKQPLQVAARFWPEIEQLKNYSSRLIRYAGELYSYVYNYAKENKAHICVVLAPEPYSSTPFFMELTDLLQSKLPDFTFQWGSAASELHKELRRRGIPVILPDYKGAEPTELMFVRFDDHLSADAYRNISAAVADHHLRMSQNEK